jgi:hypothetical protein
MDSENTGKMKNSDLIEKRELRLKIGRARRRIDAQIRTVDAESRKLVSWRTYISRYPGTSLFTAFGLGLSGASSAKLREFFEKIATLCLQRSADRAVKLVWRAWQRWRKSVGEKS